MQNNVRNTTYAAFIAALYVVLSFISSLFGLSSGVVQIRVSEMLTVLPVFTAAAVPGLTIGCFLSNIFLGGTIFDIIFGSLATLLGALGTHTFKKHTWTAPIPPIVVNTAIIPFVLRYSYGAKGALPYFFLTVGIGEILSCGILGTLLLASCKSLHRKY